MNKAAKVLGPLALFVTILSPVLFFFDVWSEGSMKSALLVAAILWFAVAPKWLKGEGP